MGSRPSDKGETASLKKRKREQKDEASPSIKRQRAKSRLEHDCKVDKGRTNEDDSRPDYALVRKANGEIKSNAESTELGNFKATNHAVAPWRLSKPMGGRILDIDPMFSPDERYLILAYNTSIQVYSTEDSLLVRRIALPTSTTDKDSSVVAAVLSDSSPEHVLVAAADGNIWFINWTSGEGSEVPLMNCGHEIFDVAVESVELGGSTREVLLVLQKQESSKAQIVAYDDIALASAEGTLLHTIDGSPQQLRAAASARVVVVAAGTALHIGLLKNKSKNVAAISDFQYRFYSFNLPDLVASLDIQTVTRPTKKGGIELQQVDIAIGGARGAIYIYADISNKLPFESSQPKAGFIHARKFHWHRRAVHAVKWSSDGNYLVSGGSEQVLVLWQLDTGKRNFLPHLSGAIENITISPRGSSYAVHMDDNSTMILSTEEMKPTTYVSGIQSISFGDHPSKDSMVRRIWQPTDQIITPLVAATNPLKPSQLLLCVGNGQQATLGGGGPSTPQIQAFDTASFQGVMKHALARTVITEANMTNQGAPIVEPTVTKLAFSGDGKWIASVDEWRPPKGDSDIFLMGSKTKEQVRNERCEIYLKFWEAGPDGKALELVTRVNEPHQTDHPEVVLDLASDPRSPRFATLGGDGIVHFWSSKMRSINGAATNGSDGHHLRIWTCSRTVTLPTAVQQDISTEPTTRRPRSGALAFSGDGSILFAAFGEPSNAVMFAIDVETGDVRETLYDVFKGEVRSIKSLGSCLVMLSEDLNVYDMVSDELLYSFALKDNSAAAKRLTQLAVNAESRTFAIAAPVPASGQKLMKKGVQSELVVFSLENPEPVFAHTFPQLITSVLPAGSSSGFMVLDSAAQIWSVTEGSEVAPLFQSLVDLGVSDAESGRQPVAIGLASDDGEVSDEEMKDGDDDADMETDEAFDIHPTVVAPQRLADIFNTAPAFAMPPIEDVFYQVAGLFSSTLVDT